MLTPHQHHALTLIIEDMRSTGVAPTQTRLQSLLGRGDAYYVLAALRDKGYVVQPYAASGWVPLKSPDGHRLRVQIIQEPT